MGDLPPFLDSGSHVRIVPCKCVVVPAAKLSMHFHLVYYIHENKTDRYSLNGCTTLGEILAGAYMHLTSGHLVRLLDLLGSCTCLATLQLVCLNKLYQISLKETK